MARMNEITVACRLLSFIINTNVIITRIEYVSIKNEKVLTIWKMLDKVVSAQSGNVNN